MWILIGFEGVKANGPFCRLNFGDNLGGLRVVETTRVDILEVSNFLRVVLSNTIMMPLSKF